MPNSVNKAIVILASSWGSKYGGLNAFSTRLCMNLPAVVQNIQIICVCTSASADDIANAQAFSVKLISLNYQHSKTDSAWAKQITSIVCDAEEFDVLWWLGHDIVSGELALACKENAGGKTAIINHMSYSDYAYVKHPSSESVTISDKIDLQRNIFINADKKFAVGPLLYERLLEILGGNSLNTKMLIPGLSDFIDEPKNKERLSVISFGRYDVEESLTKQGPLGVVAFGNAVKTGEMGMIKSLTNGPDIKIVGVSEDIADKMRKLANKNAGRVVNIKPFPYIEDQGKLKSLLQESNLSLMLSWHEGFGLTAWEAISAAIPVIISIRSGVYQLLKSLGGAALGCIESVDIKGSLDGNPQADDIREVTQRIIKVASDIPWAISNAISLRTLLRKHDCTWTKCAQSVAIELDLPLLKTPLDDLDISNPEVREGLELSSVNQLLESTKSNINLGNYAQALKTLEELRTYTELLKTSYSTAMDAALLECEVYLRQNKYPIAKGFVTKITGIAADKQDWIRWIKAKFVENTIYRDQGNYDEAIRIAEEFVHLSETKITDDYILESSYRKLSRSLSLGGNWRTALDYAQKANEMAKKRGSKTGDPNVCLAIAEAYRHGLDYDHAKEYYLLSQKLAIPIGHTDCYLWAVLGLADSLFLTNENPKSKLLDIERYLDKNDNAYPLEILHVKLSLFSIAVKFENVAEYPNELIKDYESLGIFWPKTYVQNILNKDFSIPKLF